MTLWLELASEQTLRSWKERLEKKNSGTQGQHLLLLRPIPAS